jgi:hypothetical protein
MFGTGTSIALSFDAQRRLRIIAPENHLPLAAWLHTDVQPNLASLNEFIAVLQRARQEERTLVGNGCTVDFVNDLVLLESRYETWPRQVVPQNVFWPVVQGLRAFLANTARAPFLQRPPGYPAALRMTSEHLVEGIPKPVFVNYTYFPREWSVEEVTQAGEGAWHSAELVADPATGTWSGMWRGVELAGYYDVTTGEVLTYFPVISP